VFTVTMSLKVYALLRQDPPASAHEDPLAVSGISTHKTAYGKGAL